MAVAKQAGLRGWVVRGRMGPGRIGRGDRPVAPARRAGMRLGR